MRIPYTKKELFGIGVVVALFIAAQYFARNYSVQIQSVISTEQQGVAMVLYGLFAIAAVVVAPIASLPLVPVVAAIWGSFATVVVTAIAWTLGSIIAFLLARTYGRQVIGKVVDMESMQKLEAMMGADNVFVSALLLRMVVPVDILSYALGLFSTIRLVPYSVATAIGIVPFVVFFSYAIWIPPFWQAFIAVGIFSTVIVILKKGLKTKKVS